MRLDIAVRHGSENRNSIQLAGQYVRCTVASGEVRSASHL